MRMFLVAATMLAAPALAQGGRAPVRPRPEPVSVTMTDDGFLPQRLSLRGGAPYVLRVTNQSGKGHNLTQKSFFTMARVAPEDRGWTRDGRVSLRPGESAVIHLLAPDTRPGGTYEFNSTVLGDAGKDYKGVFVIR